MKKTIRIPKKKFKSYNPKIKEECGVFGISNNEDASTLTALGLHALQHRGQEGCGIVSFDGRKYHSEKRFGLVGDNFNKEKVLKSLPGNYSIGHNRYSTTGGTTLRNIQPFFADTNTGGIGVSHNGNLTNAITLRRKLVEDGAIFYTTSDTETIVQLIARSKRVKTIDKIIDALFQIQGGYALVMLTQNTLIGVRDPFGIRPLVIGKLNNSYVFASETCALDIIGAKYIRDVENGEIVSVQDDKLVSIKPFPSKKVRPCVFEYIYFSRPDSLLNGKCAYEYRKNFGAELAKENSLKVLLGSHKFPKLVRPTKWSNDKPWYKDNENFMDMPDITKMEKNILSSKMNIGDAILFNFKVLHSSSGNTEKIPRRAFSMRFIGDDVKYVDRGGETSPPFKGINLHDGAKMREDWFPVIWRS